MIGSVGNLVVLAAGGTGGHVFPAQAVAEELLRRKHFVALITDERGRRFSKAFPRVHVVSASTLPGKGFWSTLWGALRLCRGIVEAIFLLVRLRPCLVMGFGGYPSLPPLLGAMIMRIPLCCHEPDRVLGRVNRIVVPQAVAVTATMLPRDALRAQHRGKLLITGAPTRAQVCAAREVAYEPPTEPNPIHLLVFGGSQGAHIFSRLPEALGLLPDTLRRRFRVVQQSPFQEVERLSYAYEDAQVEAEVKDFFPDMPRRLGWAHLVVSRAGSGTLGELWVVGRPALLVPLKVSSGGHQQENAQAAAHSGAAWVMQEEEFIPQEIAHCLRELVENTRGLVQAAAQAKALGRPEAAREIAGVVEEVARWHAGGAR